MYGTGAAWFTSAEIANEPKPANRTAAMFSSISPMSVRALAHVGRRLLSTSAAAPAGLRARLQNDLKTAMKNRSDKDRLSAVRRYTLTCCRIRS